MKDETISFLKMIKEIYSTDLYNHLATFKHVARAELISDLHTLVEGFGLT